ncbi:MAG: hypothetical protein ACTSUE_10515 [Promethearchaeota archaeon]
MRLQRQVMMQIVRVINEPDRILNIEALRSAVQLLHNTNVPKTVDLAQAHSKPDLGSRLGRLRLLKELFRNSSDAHAKQLVVLHVHDTALLHTPNDVHSSTTRFLLALLTPPCSHS